MTTPAGPRSGGGSGAPPSTFFLQERERLITEIADGMESLLGDVNTINRKLEESIAVGQEFAPIANLWGPFVDILTAAGIQPSDNAAAAAAAASTTSRGTSGTGGAPAGPQSVRRGAPAHEQSDDGGNDAPTGNPLPPGVAPGGGTIYGSE